MTILTCRRKTSIQPSIYCNSTISVEIRNIGSKKIPYCLSCYSAYITDRNTKRRELYLSDKAAGIKRKRPDGKLKYKNLIEAIKSGKALCSSKDCKDKGVLAQSTSALRAYCYECIKTVRKTKVNMKVEKETNHKPKALFASGTAFCSKRACKTAGKIAISLRGHTFYCSDCLEI